MQIHFYKATQSFGQFGLMVECSFTSSVSLGSNPVVVTEISEIAPVFKELLNIQAITKEVP